MPHLANYHSACRLYIARQISQRLPAVYRLPDITALIRYIPLANYHTACQLSYSFLTTTPCQLPYLANYHSDCQLYTACQRYTACQLEHSLISAYRLLTTIQLTNYHIASQLPHLANYHTLPTATVLASYISLTRYYGVSQLYIACLISQRLSAAYRLPDITALTRYHSACQISQRLLGIYRLPDITTLARYHYAY